MRAMKNARVVGSALLAVPLALAGCAGQDRPEATTADPGTCPTEPVSVVVSVDQWGDIVSQLGGACATVDTVVASSSVDPHDFEPSPADAVKFAGAQLVVLNGGHYDEWAAKLAAGSAPEAPVVSAIQPSDDHHDHDHAEGEGHDHDHAAEGNAHVWYSPTTVVTVADAVTAELSEIAPDAADYFAERRQDFTEALTPYDDAIAAIKQAAGGRSYAATESVFDPMAAELGLADRTPAGYAASSANETDPSPADLNAFLNLLADRGVDVLIYNSQTEGSAPLQLRAAAEQAGVPVVEVTETVAPEAESFQGWQVAQLKALAGTLGVPA